MSYWHCVRKAVSATETYYSLKSAMWCLSGWRHGKKCLMTLAGRGDPCLWKHLAALPCKILVISGRWLWLDDHCMYVVWCRMNADASSGTSSCRADNAAPAKDGGNSSIIDI
eukprot:10667194-Ditylum_brightwellii.AAC.1